MIFILLAIFITIVVLSYIILGYINWEFMLKQKYNEDKKYEVTLILLFSFAIASSITTLMWVMINLT